MNRDDARNKPMELRERALKISETANQHKELLIEKYEKNDPRSECFVMLGNSAVLTAESLDYFYRKPPGTCQPNEMNERCKIITKWMFIATVSTIEYSVKETIKLYPQSPFQQCFSKLGFWAGIGKKSLELGLMDEDEQKAAKFIIECRNCCVHNNGHARRSSKVKIDGRELEQKEGEMIKDKIDVFLFLTENISEWFFNWSQKLD